MDLLGDYVDRGPYFAGGSDYANYSGVALFGCSAGIDAYLGMVHELEIETAKPRSRCPFVLSGLVNEVARTGAPHRTIALLRLLELRDEDQTSFLDHIASCRKHALATSQPDSYSTSVRHDSILSWTTYFAGVGDISIAVQQAQAWAQKRFGSRRWQSRELACLVGDTTSGTRVRSVIYVPPHETREESL